MLQVSKSESKASMLVVTLGHLEVTSFTVPKSEREALQDDPSRLDREVNAAAREVSLVQDDAQNAVSILAADPPQSCARVFDRLSLKLHGVSALICARESQWGDASSAGAMGWYILSPVSFKAGVSPPSARCLVHHTSVC